jgi:threonine/homoserine/homoserine lactone efflux protein
MEYGAFASFAFVASITPGPNNLMLWADGLNFGFRRTIPHLVGITVGFVSLLLAVSLGLGTLFETVAWVAPTLRVVGSAYLLYLAYRIATSASVEQSRVGRPFTFVEAAAFQCLNPKAWLMTIAGAGTFIPPEQPLLKSTLLFTGFFGAVVVPSIVLWAAGGTVLSRLLSDPRRRMIVNVALALVLVCVVYRINT